MHTMETDRLVDDYLRRLEHAAAHMQRARRAELVAEIRGHIETVICQELGTTGDVAGDGAAQPGTMSRRGGHFDPVRRVAVCQGARPTALAAEPAGTGGGEDDAGGGHSARPASSRLSL
jgi:hypothetical protein